MPKPKHYFHQDNLPQLMAFLRTGGVLAYPSESVWGLGCDASDEQALQRIVTLKQRDLGKGLIVLTDQAKRLKSALSDELIERLQSISAKHMLQQGRASTWLVPMPAKAINPLLMGDFGTLAVRITPHPILANICQHLVSDANPYGFLVSTSCNPSGQNPATSLQEAYDYFGEEVGYLDVQSLGFKQPSQIIDLMTGKVFR